VLSHEVPFCCHSDGSSLASGRVTPNREIKVIRSHLSEPEADAKQSQDRLFG